MKIYVYISDPERYAVGSDYEKQHCFNCTDNDGMQDHGWFLVTVVDIEIPDVSREEILKFAEQKIANDERKEAAEHEVKMQRYEERRQRLLALPHKSETNNGEL